MRTPLSTWTVLAVFLASVIAITAQSSKSATEEFSFLGIGSNDSCAKADCMQGTCIPNDNVLLSVLFPYTCKCKPGWSTLAKVIPFLEIPTLPCNVPNCSLNLDCAGKSPSPSPSAPISSNNSNTCLVPGICGHGKCEVTSVEDSLVPTFKCVCDPGYANVLNMTAGFCVNHCEINGSCQDLNITLPGLGSSPPPPPSPPVSQNQPANAGTPPPSGGGSNSSSSISAAGSRSKSVYSGYFMAGALVAQGVVMGFLLFQSS